MAALAIALIAVSGWQVNRWHKTNALGGNSAAGLTLYRGTDEITVPKITGRSITGEPLSMRSLEGHVLVLNVWGSWCGPCRAEAPDLSQISRQTAPQGVRFVGIDVRDNPSAARAFEARYNITYPSFDDQSGLVLAQFAGIVPVSAVPSTLVIDGSGMIRARIVGRVDATTLRGLIHDTLAQP